MKLQGSVYICSFVGPRIFSQGRERAAASSGSLSNREILPPYLEERGGQDVKTIDRSVCVIPVSKNKITSCPDCREVFKDLPAED
jgi:hypothetical protein